MLKLIYALLLHIDGVIYNLIRWVYEIFLALAKINIFDADDYNSIIGRIYLVLGVIMLFVLAYSLLKAVVNPDDSKKDEKTAPNIIKNVVISLVIIAVLPTVFSVAFNLQNAILNSNIIPKIILNRTGVTDIENIEKNGGNTMAFYTFQSFFLPNLESDTCIQANQDLATCSADILIDAGSSSRASNLAEAYQAVYNGESFSLFSNFSEAVDDDEINYMLIVSTVAGVVLLFVIIGYTMDLAVRVVKLVFYQIIAPVAVICRIIPGDKKKAFDIWVKQVIGNFLDVFVRIAAMYLGIYLITLVVSKFGNIFDVTGGLSNLTSTQRSITLVLLIIGIILFVRQVPKLLKDLFGIEFSTEGGVLRTALGATTMGVGAIGAGITTGFRNFNEAARNTDGSIVRKGFAGFRSGIAGAASGAVRAAYGARNARNFNDLRTATNTAIQNATRARANRVAYNAAHTADNIPDNGIINHAVRTGLQGLSRSGRAGRYVANAASRLYGHASDTVDAVGTTFGFGNSTERLQNEKAVADKWQDFYKRMSGLVEDDATITQITGEYNSLRDKDIPTTIFDRTSYETAVSTQINALKADSRYAGMTHSQIKNLVRGQIKEENFTRNRTDAELNEARRKRAEDLKALENKRKLAIMRAINEKLQVDASGRIEDSRFREIANEMERYKRENANYKFIQDMDSLKQVNWDASWDNIMNNGDATQMADLLKNMKEHPDMVRFFYDNEQAKNHSGDLAADIASRRQQNNNNNNNNGGGH